VPPLGSTFGLVRPFSYGRAFTEVERLANFTGNLSATYTIGGTWLERIILVKFRLVPDATVGNRFPRVAIVDERGINVAVVAATTAITASSNATATFSPELGYGGVLSAAFVTAPLPLIYLWPNWSIVLDVPGGLVTDTVQAPMLLSEKYNTSPRDFPQGQGPELPEREVQREQIAHVGREP
jgi:hypothetical protein